MSVRGRAIEECGEGIIEGGWGFCGGGRGYDEVDDRRVCGAGELCIVSKRSTKEELMRKGKEGGRKEGGGRGVGALMMLSDTQLRRSAIVA